MYTAPKIYEDVVVATPNISMYPVRPIHPDDVTSSSGDDDVSDLARRQEKCLADLRLLQERLERVEVECSGSVDSTVGSKLDIVIGCSVGSPAVYLAAILARRSNTLIKVFSHSSNSAVVDSAVTNKLLRVNRGESEVNGVNLIYKDISAPYFMEKPGKQVAVFGLSNILRYIARSRGYKALYNEDNLTAAALIDEILALLDQLEAKPNANVLNELATRLTSASFLCGDSLTIADVGLCCFLTSRLAAGAQIPRTLREYVERCSHGAYEMRVLKAFLKEFQ